MSFYSIPLGASVRCRLLGQRDQKADTFYMASQVCFLKKKFFKKGRWLKQVRGLKWNKGKT